MRIYADEAWAKYVFRTFMDTYGIKNEKQVTLSYGKDVEGAGIFILKGEKCKKNLIFDGKQIPIFHANLKEKIRGDPIAYYDDKTPAISYDKQSKKIHLSADIIKTAFVLLSRSEEKNALKDKYGRFLAEQSMNKNIKRPIVNEYFEILLSSLKNIFEGTEQRIETEGFWPNNAPYAVCLTHDVDMIYKWWVKKTLSYILKHHKIREVLTSIGKGEYWNFDKIMDIEEEYGVKSTFFFLTSKRDFQYRYNLKKLKEILKTLDDKGWEIGLHTGFDAYNDYKKFFNEKHKIEKILGKQVSGVRNHYLRFRALDTWVLQEKLGFEYDTTLGFRETVGFRAGIAYPYFPYDFENDRRLSVLELPMTFMDNTLFMSENPQKTLDDLIKTVKKWNGLMVVNWHQRTFDEKDFPNHTNFYKKILLRFKRDGAYVSTCKNIAHRWISRKERSFE